MKETPITIRPIGNSLGIVIPKAILAQLDLDERTQAEMSVKDDCLILRKVRKPVRKGWSEAAKKIAEAGDDALVMGEFGNSGDKDLSW